MKIETITLSNTRFDKVQGQIYVDIRGQKCQVKTQYSLNEAYMELERFKNKLT
jgi:virulence-associated protein VapD